MGFYPIRLCFDHPFLLPHSLATVIKGLEWFRLGVDDRYGGTLTFLNVLNVWASLYWSVGGTQGRGKGEWFRT